MKPDQTPGANQDAGGIPVWPEAPRTEAGRALEREIGGDYGEDIAAIEREAAAAPAPRPDLDEWVRKLALVIAKARHGPGLDMGGAHNPRPSETESARRFLELYEYNRPVAAPPEPPRPLDSTKCECDCHGAAPASGTALSLDVERKKVADAFSDYEAATIEWGDVLEVIGIEYGSDGRYRLSSEPTGEPE